MKLKITILTFGLLFLGISIAFAKDNTCTTIQSGTLLASDGSVIETGYDQWGYNYQARMFNGTYCDAYRDATWCQPYKDDELMMKWNDAWLSNKDCDGDGKLDRHYGLPSYIGSGAWLTNHQAGQYTDENGETCKWNYFVKITAKPTAGFQCGSIGGNEIWGEFCEIMAVNNDKCAGFHGLDYKAEVPGLGIW